MIWKLRFRAKTWDKLYGEWESRIFLIKLEIKKALTQKTFEQYYQCKKNIEKNQEWELKNRKTHFAYVFNCILYLCKTNSAVRFNLILIVI